MDCFFAAIEIRDRPELKGKPVAVGGSSQSRGVVATANYEARKFGVKSATPSARAKKLCPDLIMVPTNYQKYKDESKKIRRIFYKYSKKVEIAGLDEAYLDVTDTELCNGLASQIATSIRQDIWDTCKLTASAGVAPNKFLAKVASDWKKPNSQTVIPPQRVEEFVKQLPVKKIPGVGPKSTARLNSMGINTCLDLQQFDLNTMEQKFGSWGYRLYYLCRGEDKRKVGNRAGRKSLSVERTFANDYSTLSDLRRKLPDVHTELQRRFNNNRLEAGSICGMVVKLKFNDFSQTTMEQKVLSPPKLAEFDRLLKTAWKRTEKPVRLMGLGFRLRSETGKTVSTSQLEFQL